jgi:hypothetical protein
MNGRKRPLPAVAGRFRPELCDIVSYPHTGHSTKKQKKLQLKRPDAQISAPVLKL